MKTYTVFKVMNRYFKSKVHAEALARNTNEMITVMEVVDEYPYMAGHVVSKSKPKMNPFPEELFEL